MDALQKEINALNQQEDPVTIKGLKISDFEDTDVFKENHAALGNLLININNKKDKLIDPPQKTTQAPAPNRPTPRPRQLSPNRKRNK